MTEALPITWAEARTANKTAAFLIGRYGTAIGMTEEKAAELVRDLEAGATVFGMIDDRRRAREAAEARPHAG